MVAVTVIRIEAPTKRSATRLRAALASLGEADLASVENAYEISLRSSTKRELLLGEVLVRVSRWARASHLTTATLRIDAPDRQAA